MNDIEKDLLSYIMSKDIDFLDETINLDILFDEYHFSLTSHIVSEDLNSYQLMLNMTLLKDSDELVKLSSDFKDSIAQYFQLRINSEEEYLMYLISLNNFLRDNNIVYMT